MKAFLLLMLAILSASCATRGVGYKQLPAHYLSIDRRTAVETFVFQISPAFQEPVGFRFEFFDGPAPRALKTTYSYRSAPKQSELSTEQAKQIKAALLAFDWNRVEDPKILQIVPDDIVILFRARLGGIYHEAVVGLSESSAVEKLLRDIHILE